MPNNIFSDDLLNFLRSRSGTNLLYKICDKNLCNLDNKEISISKLKLSDLEKNIIIENDWINSPNSEVKARCLDVLRNHCKSNKPEIVKDASNAYLDAYSQTKKYDFLIRAITIRDFKEVKDIAFVQTVINYLSDKFPPYWFNMAITHLLESYTYAELAELVPKVKQFCEECRSEQKFDKEREYVRSLILLNAIDDNESSKLLALSYESEADELKNKETPDNYFFETPNLYQKAFNNIKEIKTNNLELYERIRGKYISKKEHFAKLRSKYGNKMSHEVDEDSKQKIDAYCRDITVTDIEDAIRLLRDYIIIPSYEMIEKFMSERKKKYLYVSMLSREHQDHRGNTIGFADCETAQRIEAHQFFRKGIQYEIRVLFNIFWKTNVREQHEKLIRYIEQNKPDFIEESRVFFWTKGIINGFNGDFVSVAHILMPQLERALHNIAENKYRVITKLDKKRQEEPTLSSILDLLVGVLEEETLFEFKSFLQEGCDINFRNRLAHGLISVDEVNCYGVYLWWLCIKLYFGGIVFNYNNQDLI